MNISEEQIKAFASSILVSDIKSFINSHLKEFNEFVKNEKEKHNYK